MRGREHPHYEQELVATVGTGTDRWLTELRLAVIGITIGVALGAADIALSLSTWPVALVAGLGCTLVFVALLWRLRPRATTRRAPSDEDLGRIEGELARIRAELDAQPNPLRDLLDALAAAAEILSDYLDQIYEESYLATESTGVLRRLRDYDRRLHELTAEIRCRRTKA